MDCAIGADSFMAIYGFNGNTEVTDNVPKLGLSGLRAQAWRKRVVFRK